MSTMIDASCPLIAWQRPEGSDSQLAPAIYAGRMQLAMSRTFPRRDGARFDRASARAMEDRITAQRARDAQIDQQRRDEEAASPISYRGFTITYHPFYGRARWYFGQTAPDYPLGTFDTGSLAEAIRWIDRMLEPEAAHA